MTLLNMIQKEACDSKTVHEYLSVLNAGTGDQLSSELSKADMRTGKMPLHYAAQQGNASLVRMLVSYGAPLEAKDYAGNAPYECIPQYACKEKLRLAKRVAELGAAVQTTSRILAHINECVRAVMLPPQQSASVAAAWMWVRARGDESAWFSSHMLPYTPRPWDQGCVYHIDDLHDRVCVEHAPYDDQDLASRLRVCIRQQTLKQLGGRYAGVMISCTESALSSSSVFRALLSQAVFSIQSEQTPVFFLIESDLKALLCTRLEQIRLSCQRNLSDALTPVIRSVYESLEDASSLKEVCISDIDALKEMCLSEFKGSEMTTSIEPEWFQAVEASVKTVLYYEHSVREELALFSEASSCGSSCTPAMKRACAQHSDWMHLVWSLDSVSLHQRVEIGLLKQLLNQMEQRYRASDVSSVLSDAQAARSLIFSFISLVRDVLAHVRQHSLPLSS